jgi:hypothetical protein
MAVDVTTATRLRYDGVETYLQNELTQGVTTIEFTSTLTADGGAPIDTLVGDEYLALTVLDANYRLMEIVYLTAYESGAVTGTIERGAEGTLDVTHPADNKVVHAATAMDYILVQDHDTDASAHPEILEAANAYTDSELVSHNQPASGAHPEFAKRAGDTFTGDVVFETDVQVDGTLTISEGASLVVNGDLRIEGAGRFFLNGREMIAGNAPPTSPSANTIYIQTFG